MKTQGPWKQVLENNVTGKVTSLESGFVSSWEAKMSSTLKVIRMDSFHAMYEEMADRAKHPGPINRP